METDKQNQELKKLDPHKRLVRKVFRQYTKAEPAYLPTKKHIRLEFPKKTKEVWNNLRFYLKKHLLHAIMFLLVISICVLLFLIFSPKKIEASFVDSLNGDYIQGYVYFDGNLVGSTDGENFNSFPKEYCYGKHVIRLESEKSAFEWQTYPIDCMSKKVVFEVIHDKAQPSNNIVFKFLDSTGSFFISGKLYLDRVYLKDIASEFSVTRDRCKNLTKIKLENKDFSIEKDNNKELCDSNDLVEFKVELK